MKQQLLLTFTFSICFISALNAQEIEHEGNIYEIKGSSIILDGYDVTESLTLDDQHEIRYEHSEKMEEFRINKKSKKTQNKAVAKAERRQLKEEEKAERKAKGEKKFLIF
ncbi:hypothetical protein [Formosa sp. PL04]|uniref:hypothetical protein n=1 Tax=Formosa sp. PL04 TaxID=3081755 RepID=UPI002982601C|nr:hypothetical protein [Formosa sp. PL04]MDW5290630.1 hypothetical protein [Formosa sp. PL04]